MSKIKHPLHASLSQLKSRYETHLLPHFIDKTCSMSSIDTQRARIVPKAYGTVLEVGIGTGLNAPHYDPKNVTSVIGVDPHLHDLALSRFQEAGITLVPKPLSAERLPLEDNSVDSIVMTFTLCTIPNPQQALTEMRRVLKPNAPLFFAEHGLATVSPITALLQKKITPFWKQLAGGCHLDRPIDQLLSQAGFDLVAQQGFLHAPKVAGYHYWGEARQGKQ